MSILSPRNQHIQKGKLITYQATNPLHPNMSDDEYEELRCIYYPIKDCIQHFFIKFCSEDYVTANEKVLKELIRTGIFGPNTTGSIFTSEQDLTERRKYVYSLSYPTDYDKMQSFIDEVVRGQLEFLCRYPLNATDGITILDTIRHWLGNK